MIFVGIDVAKDKHDCFITNSDGEVLFKAFTIPNTIDGFNTLYQKITSVMENVHKVLWSSFFVTLLAKKNHYSVMQLPSLHVG